MHRNCECSAATLPRIVWSCKPANFDILARFSLSSTFNCFRLCNDIGKRPTAGELRLSVRTFSGTLGDGGCWFAALSLTRPDKRSCRRRSPLALGPANPRIKKQKQISSRRAIRKTAYETHRPPSPGSKALTNAKREQYCRSRALARSRIQAYREAGWGSRSDNASYVNACRLERRPEIRDRIGYLTRQDEDLIVEKRRRIEEQL